MSREPEHIFLCSTMLPTWNLVRDTGLQVPFGLRITFGYLAPGGRENSVMQKIIIHLV